MNRNRMGEQLGILHGGDYNPDQWLEHPEILQEDVRLMKNAKINCVSLGIFSWGKLEPEEGRYELDWMERIIQNLYENGIYTILATPTGAMPQWLSHQYPEVLQVREDGHRIYPGSRHNYCPSSPVMREKARQIDERLSERFGRHPGVIGWHISNEISNNGTDGSCHCPYCLEAFRGWLKERYGSLDELNRKWWTAFWSHTYTDWSQVRSPRTRGEVHGQNLDWKRFVSDRLLDFCKEEIRAVRRYSDLPVTTNFMIFSRALDYFKWAKEMDILSWDNYPDWHSGPDEMRIASDIAASHSLVRSMGKGSFLMMESTPSVVNWRGMNRLKRPGMHELSSLQAVACGSDSVQYFQIRKSRGCSEKYHGAVIDHKNKENTRVYRDVARLGERLEKISPKLRGTCNRAKVALVFDWENWWAVEDAWAVDNDIRYPKVFLDYFQPFWEMGVETDVVDMTCDLSPYAIVIAPMNYMYREGYGERVRRFVEQGGCYITTCWSGETDASDLVYMDRHPLEDVLGIITEEVDAPGGYCENWITYQGTDYRIQGICGLVHAKGAEVLAEYQRDFYAGYPALTRHAYGKGECYYIASMNEISFLRKFFSDVLQSKGLGCGLSVKLASGVTVNERVAAGKEADAPDPGVPNSGAPNSVAPNSAGDRNGIENGDGNGDGNVVGNGDGKISGRKGMEPEKYEAGRIWFLQNFNRETAEVELTESYLNAETGEVLSGKVEMRPFECIILEETGK